MSKKNRFYIFFVLALMLAPSTHPNEYHSDLPTASQHNGISKKVRIQPFMQQSALGDAAITSIHSHDDGNLWVAEQSGLHLHTGHQLFSFNTINPNEYYAPSLNISSISQDSSGGIWASSPSAGITKYDRENRIFKHVDGLPKSSVSQLVFTPDDTLLYVHQGTLKGYRISSRSHLLWLQEHAGTTGVVSRVLLEKGANPVIVAELGVFEIRLADNSIIVRSTLLLHAEKSPVGDQPTDLQMELLTLIERPVPVRIHRPHIDGKPKRLGAAVVTSITAMHQDLFFAGTDYGLYVFDQHGNFIDKYTTGNSGLTNNHITYLHSSDDILWIGTYEGLCYLRISDFELYNFLSDSISNEILNFSQDDLGKLWVGTYDGIYRFDSKLISHASFLEAFPNTPLVDKRIMALNVSGSDIFIGKRGSGLLIANSLSGEVVSHNIVSNRELEVTQILTISRNSVLLSSFNLGMFLLRKNSLTDGPAYLASEVTSVPITILRKHSGRVIAANESRVFVYDIESQEFNEINLAFPLDSVQPTITAIHWISGNALLIGTQTHGLFSINIDSSSENTLLGASVLKEVQSYAAAVYSIEQDLENQLWVGTSNGLFLYSDELDFIRRYSAADGLQGNKFNFGASFLDNNGFLYFGGSRGYNRFDPSRVSTSINPPKILTTKVIISGSEFLRDFREKGLESIILSHKDRFITFEFSALDYTDPESTRYRHKLVGFDPDWIDIGNRGAATYTNLPAGEYVFRVQAVNSAGIWNYDGITLNLKVEPAPWLTWWAYIFYFIIGFAAVAMGLSIFRSQTLKNQQIKQANEMQRITDRIADELQDKIDFQSKLTNSIHSYNKELLYWAKFCSNASAECGSAEQGLVHDRILFRLDVLETVQDSLYYQGERLYANLHDCANRLVEKLCQRHPYECSRLTTVNDIQKELMPAAQAVPLAIILAELLDNSLTHAFDTKHDASFIRFSLTFTADPTSATDTVRLVYQDDGCGIPPGLAFDSPESAGFAIIRHAAEVLDCELAISEKDRRMVTASFSIPWS